MIPYAETDDQKQIINATDKDKNIAIGDKLFPDIDDDLFLDFLAEWQLMIGDPRAKFGKGASLEMIFLKDAIKKLYPLLTFHEIKLAQELCVTDKLDCTAQLYNNQSFSVFYVTMVLNSYIRYKVKQLAPVYQKWHSTPPTKSDKVWTDEDKLADMKEHFIDVYNKYIEHGIIQDPLNICYRFLYRTKRFDLNTKQVEEARKYGQEQAGKFLAKEDGSVQEAVAKMKSNTRQGDTIDIKKLQDLYSRNYCVEQLFKKFTKISKLTDTFKVEEFTDKDQKKIQS